MLINRDFQIWLAVAADDSRLTLTHVEIKADPGSDPDDDGYISGTAAATDGWILAVVPVKLFAPGDGFDYARSGLIDPDIPGLLAPTVFKAALKVAKSMRVSDLTIDLSKADLAGLHDGSWLPRQVDPDMGNYPDWAPIVPKRQSATERRYHFMAAVFQPKFYDRVSKAIGCQTALNGPGSGQGSGLPRLIVGKPDQDGSTTTPFIVEPMSAPMGSDFVPPYGVIMPIHLGKPEGLAKFYTQG